MKHSNLPTVTVSEALGYTLRWHFKEYFPKVSATAIKMYKDDIFLIDSNKHTVLYAINLNTWKISCVAEQSPTHSAYIEKYFENWVEETKFSFMKELQTVRNKYKDF